MYIVRLIRDKRYHETEYMAIFPEKTRVGQYAVQRLIKENAVNASYLVTDDSGKSFFMKVFDMGRVPEKLVVDGTAAEIAFCQRIQSANIISGAQKVDFSQDGVNYQCMVAPFFRGRLLSEVLKTGKVYSSDEAKGIVLILMRALAYLHNELGLCHNDITPQNILLEEGADGSITPKIIDLGHTFTPVNGAPPFPVEDLHVLYLSPEALKGVFYPEGDVFSLSAVLYHMLTGKAPWYCETSKQEPFAVRKQKVRAAREAALVLPEGLDAQLSAILDAGLKKNRNERANIKSLLKILEGDAPAPRESHRHGPEKEPRQQTSVEVRKNEPGKGGFADVAGMDALKESLNQRVIWVIRDKEKAQKYRLSPPNGMLLYGPPGCGKTFFAQKFAEESGFNYMLVNGSDLGSTFVHGTQGKIAELFKEAEKNAPTVICFDEFDSFVPTRGSASAQYRADEVNEFLSQLNNCASRGIFVIGTTNRIDMIDPAILRKGRLDLHVEIPAPDAETRSKMFSLHLKGRPQEEGIDTGHLAELTEGYAAADIAFIVNEAAMVAALADEPISVGHLEQAVRNNVSSLARTERRKIGF